MGMPTGVRISSCHDTKSYAPVYQLPVRSNNPDPHRFKVKSGENFGHHCVVVVEYPDCTNYEGKKILLYLHTQVEDIMSLKTLDPHFCDDDHLSPFARFEPTNDGWQAATHLAADL